MISRLVQYGGRILIVMALVALPVTSTRVVAKQKELPNISGTWKLNVEASTNPNGPAPAQTSAGRAQGGGGGDVGGGGAAGAGGGAAGGAGAVVVTPAAVAAVAAAAVVAVAPARPPARK